MCPPPDQLSKTRGSEVHTRHSPQPVYASPPWSRPLIVSPIPACQLMGKTGLRLGSLSDPPPRIGLGRHGTQTPTALQRVHQSWVDTCPRCLPPCLCLGSPHSASP